MESQNQTEQLALLRQMAERLERLEQRVEQTLAPAEQVLPTAAIFVDTADEIYQKLKDADIDGEERARALLRLLERASRADTIEPLMRLMAHTEQLVMLAEEAPGMASMFVDMFDQILHGAMASGIEPGLLLQRGTLLAERSAKLMQSETFHTLLEDEHALERLLHTATQLSQALAESRQDAPKPHGLFAMWRASRDPHVQRSIGFALDLAKRFGKRLQNTLRASK